MKNLLPVGLVCLLLSCSKSIDKVETPVQEPEKETCTFGIENFNLAKREPLSEIASRKPNNPGNGNNNTGGGGSTTPTPTTTSGVILLDFDGHVVSGTAWNYYGDIRCSPSNMTTDEMSRVLNRVNNDYSPFNMIVTTDESVFNAAPITKRTRVIITETWEWFGQAGGTSFINSFKDGSGAPCFVFSSLLNYNSKNIGEAASHEAGHTLGLRHQSTYSGCTKIDEYNQGNGYGETGWAPIMGNSYSQNLSLWHNGTSSYSCSSTQDDVAIIASTVGIRTDDHSNTISGASVLSSSQTGVISTSNDMDFFTVSTTYSRTLSLAPANVGAGNAGGNTDLVLRVYNSQGSLLSTINDPSILNANTVIAPGTYFVSVGTASNSFATTYGMLGRYSLNLY